ncbi:MAG: hypothetical protein CFE24_09360 [Flavobacterium sp. BFFFF2]|nr:MAG: hypothetical protein CFE24_09360 [Flavobacterium sp. BFFFF2]
MSTQMPSSEEQISIIESSLKHSSSQKTGASNYYIIWGATLAAFYFVQFLHAHFKTPVTANLANISTLFFAVGGLFSYLQSKKDSKTETMIPLNEKVYTYGWIGASIGLAVLNFTYLSNFLEMLCVGVLLIFGLVNFIIGGITHFKPLVVGGVLSMLLCILITKCAIEYQFLLTAIGVLFSCLIPGLMMKSSTAHV